MSARDLGSVLARCLSVYLLLQGSLALVQECAALFLTNTYRDNPGLPATIYAALISFPLFHFALAIWLWRSADRFGNFREQRSADQRVPVSWPLALRLVLVGVGSFEFIQNLGPALWLMARPALVDVGKDFSYSVWTRLILGGVIAALAAAGFSPARLLSYPRLEPDDEEPELPSGEAST